MKPTWPRITACLALFEEVGEARRDGLLKSTSIVQDGRLDSSAFARRELRRADIKLIGRGECAPFRVNVLRKVAQIVDQDTDPIPQVAIVTETGKCKARHRSSGREIEPLALALSRRVVDFLDLAIQMSALNCRRG